MSPWPIFGLALFALVPAAVVLVFWRERSLLVTAGRRLLEAEEAATERHREADSITRLSSALLQVQTAREAAERLFEELESTTGVEVALLLKVDEDERRASGFAARGVDESWLSWRDGLQGTGLGLFLSRGLLAAMRGRIWVESKEGEGSIFAFELPVASQAPVGMEEMEAAGRS